MNKNDHALPIAVFDIVMNYGSVSIVSAFPVSYSALHMVDFADNSS